MTLANKLTLARIAMIPLFMLAMLPRTAAWDIAAAAIFALAALTDHLDGHIARKYGQITNFGKFLDPIADKLLVSAALVLLTERGLVPGWVTILFIAREFVVSGVRLVAVEQGMVIAAGPLGKAKMAAQVAAVLLLLAGFLLDAAGPVLAQIALYASLALAVWSGVDYLWRNRAVLDGGGRA